MKINRIWAMPNKWTFTIRPINDLLKKYGPWEIDPFAGKNSPAKITNDINPENKAIHAKDALVFLRSIESESTNSVLYDPPYSFYQAKTEYAGYGSNVVTNMNYWKLVKDEIARVCKQGAIVFSCGWNSGGMGKGRGFQILEILIVNHGGSKNDTICTIERKLEAQKAEATHRAGSGSGNG